MPTRRVASLLAAAWLWPAVVSAAEPPGQVAQEQAEQAALEAQIAKELGAAAGSSSAPAAGGAASAPGAATTPPAGSPAGLARVLLLPDISAVGSFAGVLDSYDAGTLSPRSGPTGPAGEPTFLFQELELALQAVVDPYARADVFVSFTPAGVTVEEAYLTTLSLPAGLQLKAGTLYTPFGRINTTHPHTWEFLDGSLAHDRLLGDEKLGGPGLDLAWLAPLPWFAELHLAAQSTAPYEGQAPHFTATARLAQFFGLSDAATLGLGLSAARRDEGEGGARHLLGADLLLKVRPPAGRASVTLQAEWFARGFQGAPEPGAGGPPTRGGLSGQGGYAQLFWRQDAWWGWGLRWELAPEAFGPGGQDGFGDRDEQRWSAVGDWFATEFQRVGLQIALDQRPGASPGWEWLLHWEFVIGAHGAHPF